MNSTDIEVIPEDCSISEPSLHVDSKDKLSAAPDPQDSKTHSDIMDHSTTTHNIPTPYKFRRSNKVSMVHKIRITKYATYLQTLL